MSLVSARRWSDEKLKQNLWCKKGMNVIGRRLQCPCGKGVLDAREDFRVVSLLVLAVQHCI